MDNKEYEKLREAFDYIKKYPIDEYFDDEICGKTELRNCPFARRKLSVIEYFITQQKPLEVVEGKFFKTKHDIPFGVQNFMLLKNDWSIIYKDYVVKVLSVNKSSVLVTVPFGNVPIKRALIPVELFIREHFGEYEIKE